MQKNKNNESFLLAWI